MSAEESTAGVGCENWEAGEVEWGIWVGFLPAMKVGGMSNGGRAVVVG